MLKDQVLGVLSGATRRHAVLLPSEAASEERLFPVVSDYRVDGAVLRLQLQEPATGRLRITLMGYDRFWPGRPLLQTPVVPYAGPSVLEYSLEDRRLRLNDIGLGQADPIDGRRFAFRFEWTGDDGRTCVRKTGHYLPARADVADQSYFYGQNYVDYEAQGAASHRTVIDLVRKHQIAGPILEAGCATGGLLDALDHAGIRGYGVDSSAWAVQQTNERLREERAWVCDLEHDALPAAVAAQAPFRALLMWSTYEHFRDPPAVLARLSAHAVPGTLLFLDTTNADSLSHQLFGPQWEGYFDATHFGVERVGVRTLQRDLPSLGWRILQLTTRDVWDSCIDPSHATLRDWYVHDARFRALLRQRDLGDFVTCVAVKE